MRWYPSRPPLNGDVRVISFFAWLPVTVGDCDSGFETRWLEPVTVEQEFRGLGLANYWNNVRFVDGKVAQ